MDAYSGTFCSRSISLTALLKYCIFFVRVSWIKGAFSTIVPTFSIFTVPVVWSPKKYTRIFLFGWISKICAGHVEYVGIFANTTMSTFNVFGLAGTNFATGVFTMSFRTRFGDGTAAFSNFWHLAEALQHKSQSNRQHCKQTHSNKIPNAWNSHTNYDSFNHRSNYTNIIHKTRNYSIKWPTHTNIRYKQPNCFNGRPTKNIKYRYQWHYDWYKFHTIESPYAGGRTKYSNGSNRQSKKSVSLWWLYILDNKKKFVCGSPQRILHT